MALGPVLAQQAANQLGIADVAAHQNVTGITK